MRRSALLGASGNNNSGVGSTLLFESSFESAFTDWHTCQWQSRNDDCSTYNGTSEYPATIVTSDGRPTAARFELRDGDVPPFGGNERTEITAPPICDVTEGDERWWSWDMAFSGSWTAPTGSFCLVMQWHHLASESGSPPLCLDIDTDNHMYVANNDASGYTRLDIGPVDPGEWHNYSFHAVFSEDDEVGFVEARIDGALVLPRHYHRTLVVGDGGGYLKFGIYRASSNTATHIVLFDNVRVYGP